MNQWINDPVKQWTSESMNRPWVNELVIQWTDEPTNHWISESVKQRSNESMNPWRRESKNQWIRVFLNPWITDQWLNEWTHGWMDGWMDGRTDGWMGGLLFCWATSSLSDLFAEIPLVSAASYLSSFLSGLVLLLTASQLPLLELLQHNSSLRTGRTGRFATSSCYAAKHKSSNMI